MKFITEGLILTEQTLKEKDKLVTVFTRSNGIIRCFAHGAKSIKAHSGAALQPLTYSRLSIFSSSRGYVIDEATVISSFFDVTKDLEKVALAQYICELASVIIPECTESESYLNLTLNTLYVLSQKKHSPLIIKASYEMRLLSITGNPPDLICCNVCKEYETEPMYFLYRSGKLLCKNCYSASQSSIQLSKGALTALRHSIFAEDKKLFSFSASEESIAQFADCAERYTLACTERSLKTLEFYKLVRSI